MNLSALKNVRRIANFLSGNGRFPLPQTLARRAFRNSQGTVTIPDYDSDLTMDLSLSEHMQRRIFWMGFYSQGVVALIKRTVTEDMTVVDVGANVGEITLVCSKLVGSGGHVLAFEPVERILKSLTKNVAANAIRNVSIFPLGLADHDGSATIYESCGQGASDDEHHGLGSLYGKSDEHRSLGVIKLARLDRICEELTIRRIDLIKIDIEGAELACLRGAKDIISLMRPRIIIEIQEYSSSRAGYEQGDILDFLSLYGYEFYSIDAKGRTTPLLKESLGAYQNVYCVPCSTPTQIS